MNKLPYYTSSAKEDLASILNYIARDKPDAAIAWVERIEAKCSLIAAAPHAGELMPQLCREVRANYLGRYVIFHRYRNQQVEFLRVIAGDRDITEL